MEVDPRYLRAGVRKNKASAYVVFFHRQKVVDQPTLPPGVSIPEARVAVL